MPGAPPRTAAAGALLGLATHWRVYPVIYLLPVLRSLHLARTSAGAQHQRGEPADRHGQAAKPARSSAIEPFRRARPCMGVPWPTHGMLKFAAAFAATFAGLAALCHAAYGDSFLEQAYLYHGRRVDPRHNFSPARLESPSVDGSQYRRVTQARSAIHAQAFYPAYLALGRASYWHDGCGARCSTGRRH